jgi:hypothetical protein
MPPPNDGPSAALEALVTTARLTPEQVRARTTAIYQRMQEDAPHLRAGNFATIAAADLARLFDLYDERFFEGRVVRALQEHDSPLNFRLAPRMTRAGGKTYRWRHAHNHNGQALLHGRYEIAVSSTLLFQSFTDVQREVRINGHVCADRLQALQRIMEHELLHLIELIVWDESSCKGENFQSLALRLFAHTDVTHDLVTQHERAEVKFAIQVGDRVAFEFEGVRHVGIVNRITRRATVLVPHANGVRYTDGQRYAKFYIPLGQLEKVA